MTSAFLAIKDLALILLLVINLVALRQLPMQQLRVYLPIAIFLIIAARHGLSMPVIASLRQLIVPFLILSLGWYWGKGYGLKTLDAKVLPISYFLLGGCVVAYILAYGRIFPIEGYAEIKVMELDQYGSPLMFEDSLTGKALIRNFGTYLDPINLGHSLLFLLVYGTCKRLIPKWVSVVLLVAVALTVSKGALLQLAMVIFLLGFKWIGEWLKYLLIIVSMVVLLYLFQWHHGVHAHTEGLITAIQHASLFGEGLAQVGNQAVLFGKEVEIPIFDTYLGSVLGQLGVIGLLCWLLPFGWLVYRSPDPVLKALLLSQLLIAAVSENSFNFLSVVLLLLFYGAYSSRTADTEYAV